MKEVSDETKAEVDEVVSEAEVLVAEFLGIDQFDVQERHDTGKSSLPEALVIKLTCGFFCIEYTSTPRLRSDSSSPVTSASSEQP